MKTNKVLSVLVATALVVSGISAVGGVAIAADVQKPKIKLCGGPKGLSYIKIAEGWGETLRSKFDVEVLETKGGKDNVQKVHAGECDAGIAPDFVAAGAGVTISTSLFKSYGIFLCNANIIGKKTPSIKDLYGRKDIMIANGVKGSTANEVWTLLASNNQKFAALQTSPVDFNTALMDVLDGSMACTWAASGVNSDLLKAANTPDASKLLTLVSLDDGKMDDVKAGGKEVISFAELTSKEFPQLLPSGMMFDKKMETITFNTSVIINSSLMVREPRAYGLISQTASNLGKQK